MAIPWSCDPHTPKSDYYGGPDSPGFTIWPDGAICSGLTRKSGHLINAASDLLAALKEAYDALDYAQAQVDSDTDRMHLTRCRRKIKPVIDRAEGRDE